MKVKAEDIRAGDRINAYVNNGRQTCIVRNVLNLVEHENIVLTVSTPKHNYRNSGAKVIRFNRDALVDIVG